MAYAHSGPAWVEITDDPATRVIPGKGKQMVETEPGSGIYEEAPDSLTIPPGWENDPAHRIAAGIVEVFDPPHPANAHVTGSTIVDIAGQPTRQWITEPFSLDERKAAKLSLAAATYEEKLAVGYPVTLGGNDETLQCRNEHDRTNWLGLLIGAQTAVGLGAGASAYPVKIRCTSNAEYSVTNTEAVALMLGLLGWAGTMLAAYWAVKDSIKDAPNGASVDAVDVSAGYP